MAAVYDGFKHVASLLEAKAMKNFHLMHLGHQTKHFCNYIMALKRHP